MNYFKNKTFSVATKHKKETVFRNVFTQLGLSYFPYPEIDTDILGTFTGEIERKYSPLETAVHKAKLLATQTKSVDFIIANEGSFGPHPYIPFVASDSEVIVLFDTKNNNYFIFTMYALKQILQKKKLHLLTNYMIF